MTMMRWEPFREMMSLRNAMDRLFDESFVRPSRVWVEEGTAQVPLDVYQTDNEVVVKATLPGVKPDEVDITITGDALIIKGEHKEEKEVKDESYIRRERRSGSFTRTVLIPVSVQSDKAEATFENGVLTLTLPKVEEIKPRLIKVKPKMRIEGEKGK